MVCLVLILPNPEDITFNQMQLLLYHEVNGLTRNDLPYISVESTSNKLIVHDLFLGVGRP